MANQINIDIGAAANDGTGDPLRTAFNYVNNNFSNVWNTGLPNSNVQFSDNRILTVNTNANLVLAPNGIGKVASNVDIVPNTANVFALGGASRRWNTVYGQYLDLSHNAVIGGNLVVTGNLSAGNISYTSNVFVGDLEGSVFDGASSIVLDVIDSTIYVDNYRYANGVPVSFGGNYSNANVAAYLPTYTGNLSANNITAGNVFTAQTVTANDAYINTGTFAGDENTGDAAMYVGSPTFTNLGSDIMAQFTGNVTTYAQINLQNWSNAATASGDYILTADNGNDSTHFLDMGITSSTWDGTQTNVLTGLNPNNGYLYVQDGNLTLGTRAGNVSYSWKFDTTGNLTVAGNVIPTGNNTQSLGSATQQWNDLYLSNATIYMNSVPISLTADNVLTVNGADVVTTNSEGQANIGNLDINGTVIQIAEGASETLINITPSGPTAGWAYLQLPTNGTANTANTRLHNDAGNIEFGTGDFSTGSTNYTWTFNNTGTLVFPANPNGQIYGGQDNDFIITTSNANAATYYFTFSQLGDLTVPINLNVSGNVYTNDIVGAGAGNITITANTQSWLFDDTGMLTLPSEGQIRSVANTGMRLSAGASDVTGLLLNNTGDAELYANANVSVYTDSGNTGWTFDTAGNLTLPGNAGANNASISATVNGSILGLNSQANGSVRLRAYGSAANLVAGMAVFGEDGEVDRVQISTYNPGIDDNNAWVFNTSGDLTTPDGNIFFGTGANSAVIVPAGNSVKIAADRGNTSKNYIDITSSGITIDALGGSTADIRIRAADDIFVQGGDKTSAPGQRGGDINIDGGQGGPDNGVNAGDGGDIAIQGGLGGEILAGGSGDGGDVTLLGGTGSTANVANLLGAGRGGLVVIQGGQGGDQAGNTSLSERGGNVDIYGGQGSFDFANTLPSGLPGHVNLYGGNWGFVNAPSGNIYLNTYDGTNFKTLTYDTAGNVTMAAGGALNMVGSSSGIVQSPNNDLIVTVQDDDNDDWALYNRITDTGATLGETRLRRGDFRIDFPGVSKTFTFDDSGVLSLPGDIASSTQGGDISLYAIDDGDSGSAEIKTISFAGSTLGSNVRVTQSNATISTSNAAYTWTFDNTGNLTVPGNTIVSTANATGGLGGKSVSITAGASDAVTWNSNPGGNVNITGGYGSFGGGGGGPGGNVNITSGGSSDSHAGNVTINSGANAWNFDYTGNLDAPGNITSTNFVGNGAALTNVATQVTGSWTLAAGTNTANITVPPNGTYTIWVNGNIPNGIAVWNATVTITNNNVPVIGQQFAWNYSGNALVITSIPSQIIGTAGAISNASPAVGTTTNVFEFSIDNNSGNSQTVDYGWTKL
jgi:hypothetical protein